MSGHIVLVVQDKQTHERLIDGLAADGYAALCFHSVEEAVGYLRQEDCPASVVVFSLAVRRQNDFLSLSELCANRPDLQMLFVAQDGNSILASLSSCHGSIRMLDLPLDHPESGAILRVALESAEIEAFEQAEQKTGPTASGRSIVLVDVPHSTRHRLVLPYTEDFLERVGKADVPVLLSGETGAGKEVMARRLCAYSARATKPFLKLNCAALPPELAESELFGCVKGAFTGATADRAGRFEIAQGGTILLDEIGDMDLKLQTKLLQVLQDGEIQPLGSNKVIKVNVRVMAASHRDLTKGIQEGTFREDLYYRLNVIKIVIPPLRERQEEILPLAQALLIRHTAQGQQAPPIDAGLKRFLVDYSWPGNVRELENVMRRFIVYQDSKMLIAELTDASAGPRTGIALANVASFPDSQAMDSRIAGSNGSSFKGASESVARKQPDRENRADSLSSPRNPEGLDRLAEASRTAETRVLLEALEACRWNRRQAAASLQIEYKAFLYKLQKYGIVDSKVKRREISA